MLYQIHFDFYIVFQASKTAKKQNRPSATHLSCLGYILEHSPTPIPQCQYTVCLTQLSFRSLNSKCRSQEKPLRYKVFIFPSHQVYSLLEVSETEDGGASSESTTGCVNIAVLMPVLAVAVLALLLFIHLVIQGKRKRDRELKMTKKNNGNISAHSDGSNVVIGETIEMHANGHVIGLSGDGLQAPGTPISNHVSRSNAYESLTGSPSIGRVSRGHAPGSPVGHVPRSPALRHAS